MPASKTFSRGSVLPAAGVLLAIMVPALAFVTLGEQQQFAIEPLDQVAVVGTRVILPCRVLNKKGILQWTKDDFGLGTRRRLSAFERYTMVGSDEEGDFSLNIYPVTLDDDAKYQCQLGPGPRGEHGIRSKYAALSVLQSPDPPKILQGDTLTTTEDHVVELECVSENGKPAAEITWIDGSGAVLTADIEYTKVPSPDIRLFTAKSILKLKASKELHNRTVHCQAQNSADKTYSMASIRIEVKYAPKVRVAVVDGADESGYIPIDSTVRLRCETDANPNEITYQWFVNDEMVPGADDVELEMPSVTRKYQSHVVKCEAQNVVGLSADSETLDVKYPPSFIERPQSIESELGENITMHCIVDSNPKADIVWVFDPIDRMNFQPRVVGVAETLHVLALNETAGRYYCKAHSAGFTEISAEALIILKGPPKIVSPHDQYPLDAHTHQLECVAVAVPQAKHISWAFNGILIDADKEFEYTVRENMSHNHVRSVLSIEQVRPANYGTYTCTVINKYGSDALDIVFHERRVLPIIVIASGSCAFSILIVAVCLAICCCLKGKKKRELPPADIIPKVNPNKTNSLKKKELSKSDIPAAVTADAEYQESNSGSYSTTTTLSINKNELVGGKLLSLPPAIRYSENFTDGLSASTNQSITGTYVDYARDYYTPNLQNTSTFLIQANMQRGETPTYV